MSSFKRANNLVNKIHERTLRLIHNSHEYRFNGLSEIKNEVTFHIKKNQKLMIELYKYFNGLLNSITNKIFSKSNIAYNLRNYREIASHKKLTG